MENLILNGTITIDNMKFQSISGGFGPGKKAILAKDIAGIHGRELKEINKSIARNLNHFTDGVDYIDLKGKEIVGHLITNNIMTAMEVGKAEHIWLLSQRGYAKLIKVLEDDTAWAQYDILLDNYFHMQEELTQILGANLLAATSQLNKLTTTVNEFVKSTNAKIQGIYKRSDGLSYYLKDAEDDIDVLEDSYRKLETNHQKLEGKFGRVVSLLTYTGDSFKATVVKLIEDYAPGRASIILARAAEVLKREHSINLELRFRHYRAKMAKSGYSEEEINKASRLDVLEGYRYNRERSLFLDTVKRVIAEEIGKAS